MTAEELGKCEATEVEGGAAGQGGRAVDTEERDVGTNSIACDRGGRGHWLGVGSPTL